MFSVEWQQLIFLSKRFVVEVLIVLLSGCAFKLPVFHPWNLVFSPLSLASPYLIYGVGSVTGSWTRAKEVSAALATS